MNWFGIIYDNDDNIFINLKNHIMVVDLKANEMVIKAADSHQVIDNQSVKGKFIVTNQRIYFISEEEKSAYANREINPDQILEVIYITGKKFFSKGLNVVTKNGDNHLFLLTKRNEFGQLINKMY